MNLSVLVRSDLILIFFLTKVKSLLLCKSFYFLFRRLGWFSGGVLISVILFHFYSIEGLLLKLGIPMIVFCTANESGSEQETDAGVGAQESSGARPQGASNIDIEASGGQKASPSPGDGDDSDSGPSNHPSSNTPPPAQQQTEEPTGEQNKSAPPTPPTNERPSSPEQPEQTKQRSAAGGDSSFWSQRASASSSGATS